MIVCPVHPRADAADRCPACRLALGLLDAPRPLPTPGPCPHRGAVQEAARCPRNNVYDCLKWDEDVTEEPIGKTARNCRECRRRREDQGPGGEAAIS